MTDLVAEIEMAFGSERMPSDAELVRFDGFDELGKSYLLEHLSGKSQDDVLRLLREGTLGDGSMCTEELEVAEAWPNNRFQPTDLAPLGPRLKRGVGPQEQNRVELPQQFEVAHEFHDRARTRRGWPVACGSP